MGSFKILIVEDSESDRKKINKLLADYSLSNSVSFEVVAEAADLSSARTVLNNHIGKFDILILDIEFPTGGGIDTQNAGFILLNEFKNHLHYFATIILSAHADEAHQGFDFNVFNFVPKKSLVSKMQIKNKLYEVLDKLIYERMKIEIKFRGNLGATETKYVERNKLVGVFSSIPAKLSSYQIKIPVHHLKTTPIYFLLDDKQIISSASVSQLNKCIESYKLGESFLRVSDFAILNLPFLKSLKGDNCVCTVKGEQWEIPFSNRKGTPYEGMKEKLLAYLKLH